MALSFNSECCRLRLRRVLYVWSEHIVFDTFRWAMCRTPSWPWRKTKSGWRDLGLALPTTGERTATGLQDSAQICRREQIAIGDNKIGLRIAAFEGSNLVTSKVFNWKPEQSWCSLAGYNEPLMKGRIQNYSLYTKWAILFNVELLRVANWFRSLLLNCH